MLLKMNAYKLERVNSLERFSLEANAVSKKLASSRPLSLDEKSKSTPHRSYHMIRYSPSENSFTIKDKVKLSSVGVFLSSPTDGKSKKETAFSS